MTRYTISILTQEESTVHLTQFKTESYDQALNCVKSLETLSSNKDTLLYIQDNKTMTRVYASRIVAVS